MNERDIETSKRLSAQPVKKRRASSTLMPLIGAQRRRIARQGYLVDAAKECVEEARRLGDTGVEQLRRHEISLAESLEGMAILERRLADLLSELDLPSAD